MTSTLRRPPWTPELYARAVASAALPGFLWGGGDVLPDKALQLDGVRFTPERIAAYRAVCGATSDAIAPAMPHLPGFPLALRLMTARDFPMSALGMVHIANEIQVLSPLDPNGTYEIAVRLGNPLRHSRGTQFDALTTASIGGEVVWREASTYLSRGTRLAEATHDAVRVDWPAAPADADQTKVVVPQDTGRRYAAVSGDRNPIHLHPLTAKAFGFRTTIAHGMWTLARALAQVEPELPPTYTVTAGFFKPVFLPAECTLKISRTPGQWSLWMVTGNTQHAAVRVQAV